MRATLVALLTFVPALALAQEKVSESAAPNFAEVERGGYAGASFGFALAALPDGEKGLATGTAVDLHLGYDVASWLGFGAFAWGGSFQSPASATNMGDFTALFPGAEIRLYVPLASDGNGVRRLFLGIRAGGGAMLVQASNAGSAAAAGRAGVSLEYFTRLRHFSIGLAADGVATAGSSFWWSGAISPFARYSF